MPNEKMLTPEEAYLDRVKSARATSAVLKASPENSSGDMRRVAGAV